MTVQTFRKKPIEIEAARVSDILAAAKSDWVALPSWIREAYDAGKILFLPDCIEIDTLEGRMTGGWTDWIVQGVQGELYPCKPDILDATYDRVTSGGGK